MSRLRMAFRRLVVAVLAVMGHKSDACSMSAEAVPFPSIQERAQHEAPSSPAAEYPVLWTDFLQLPSLGEVEAQLGALDRSGFGELSHNGEVVTPTTCRQWIELTERGFEPSTGVEAQADGGARFRCGTLLLLLRAQPAATSLLRNLEFDPALLTKLPADLATADSDERTARVKAASEAGKSLADFDPGARAANEASGQKGLWINEGEGQSSIWIEPQAWGDFDGDTVDDVVIAVTNSMVHGSAVWFRLIVLTRTEPDGMLRVVPIDVVAGASD